MSRTHLTWNVFGLITAGTLLVAACAPAAAPSPTAAPAKPTAAAEKPAAEKPAAEKPAEKAAAPAAKADPVAAKLDEYYQKAKASGEMSVVQYGPGPEYQPFVDAFKHKFPGTSAESVNLRGI